MDMQNITNFDYKKSSYDEDAKLKKIFEREIRPKTNSVWFHFEESVVKSERLLSEKAAITKAQIELGTVEKEIVQNIGVPEMEDIDYSLIKDKKLRYKAYKERSLRVLQEFKKTLDSFSEKYKLLF